MTRHEDKQKVAALQTARTYLADNAMWLVLSIPYDLYLDCLVDALRTAQPGTMEQLLVEARAGERYADAALRRAAETLLERGEALPGPLAKYVVAIIKDEAPKRRSGRAKFETGLRDQHIAHAVSLVIREHQYSQRRAAAIVCSAYEQLVRGLAKERNELKKRDRENVKFGALTESAVIKIAGRA